MQRRELIIDELSRVDGHAPGSGLNKHKKMCTSSFVFYRGSAQLFYADLANRNIDIPSTANLPLTTVMGDCHTSNFGFFTEEGSFGERIVFSLNDFDDACIGVGIWDLMRLLTSFSLVQRHCESVVKGDVSGKKDYSDKSFVEKEHVDAAMQALLDSYVLVLKQGLSRKASNDHFLELTFEDFATPSALQKRYQKASKLVVGGEKFMRKSALAKAIDLAQFPLTFRDNPDKFADLDKSREAYLLESLAPYFFHQILDIVGRVGSGTGSANLNRYYALVGPQNTHAVEQLGLCHVVEIKQQRQAAPIHYFPDLHHQNKLNPAHLTVKCQRRMQRRHDFVLDEAYFDDKHWLVRSRHHAKVGINPEHIGIGDVNTEQGGMSIYASACGQELARAHCRGDRFSLDYESQTMNYIEAHRDALIKAALDYAFQVEKDWQQLCELENLKTD